MSCALSTAQLGEPESTPPNGLELSCPAEAGNSPLLYGTPAGQASRTRGPARRVSFSELLGGAPRLHAAVPTMEPVSCR